MKALEKVRAQFGGSLWQLLFDDNAQSSSGDGAAERIAAEGASVISGLVYAQDFARGENGRDWVEAAGECFADDQDVGCDALVHIGE